MEQSQVPELSLTAKSEMNPFRLPDIKEVGNGLAVFPGRSAISSGRLDLPG